MPIPKLLTVQGKKMPDWNLTSDQLNKEQTSFREAVALEPVTFGLTKTTKKAAKKKAAKKGVKKAAKKSAAKKPASDHPLVTIKPKDLVITASKISDIAKLVLSRTRKNQKNFTAAEWNAYINAIQAIAAPGAAAPTFQDFVNIHSTAMTHAGHEWGVHTMMGMSGRNFLAWHREYLAKLEARLILANPLATIPYWDWVVDRAVPAQLSDPSDLAAWGITRGTLHPNELPVQADVNTAMSQNSFTSFQTSLESGPHNWVHNAVGGTMATSASPADPLFWLHHANVDRIWAEWQKMHTGAAHKPSNLTETLKPTPIITRKVSEVLSTSSLGYVYV